MIPLVLELHVAVVWISQKMHTGVQGYCSTCTSITRQNSPQEILNKIGPRGTNVQRATQSVHLPCRSTPMQVYVSDPARSKTWYRKRTVPTLVRVPKLSRH